MYGLSNVADGWAGAANTYPHPMPHPTPFPTQTPAQKVLKRSSSRIPTQAQSNGRTYQPTD